ncbi:MAG: Translation elongation factor P Lys34:lysine transferase [Candidatus Magasanikbacteria bacterium GW2011_GWD2_43_18]|nr:MAG: Translation elongation factor P Lys34:lysine transferase [Candidatus Magasanikbacteria bacterium GW2011_GWC2_42_27]KKT04201.1 MAG: Translation elongation factor P Lys34:lysine transferase [Candidatus Magasanikbacteria bacterium GW2011_GWD2_43_18]KKT25895.1 MAG: Translation elongation factor P Lys34:lysine transferase [Candidatus Magasanikbacteria bacterium GW2011_GWA2_43_9]HBB37874.1 EF-P lysine aminoacylase GenX [Candidatus Magasanikbacteria bacterium]HCM53959.1 EF-P lysine aminoacylas
MSIQIDHIQKNKDILTTRALIIREIREFFWQQDFLEGETPYILHMPGQEPYLSPVELTIHNDRKQKHPAFLHTSPEYTLKKMLAAGFGNIFFLGKTFRDYESFGGTHNPEFTMLEWYRVGATMFDLMEDVESLFSVLQEKMKNEECRMQNAKFVFQRKSMKEVWIDTINVNLDEHLTQETMYSLCKKRGYTVAEHESYEDLFYRIFLNEIEPTFDIQHSAFLIYNYPAPMAALAKLSESQQGYAERFEVYIHGMEIANAFSELTDPDEQLQRLKQEQTLRKKLGKTVYDIDIDFVEAVDKLPQCAGIALGVDRLVQILLGEKNIDNVLTLPMSKLFS